MRSPYWRRSSRKNSNRCTQAHTPPIRSKSPNKLCIRAGEKSADRNNAPTNAKVVGANDKGVSVAVEGLGDPILIQWEKLDAPHFYQVARRYSDLLDGYIIDAADAADACLFDIPVAVTKTLMVTLADREALAREVLACADALSRGMNAVI